MEHLWIVVLLAVVVAGLMAASRARRGQRRERDVLAAIGLGADAPGGSGKWNGRALSVSERDGALRLRVPLAPAPLEYEAMARALGRGDLLAALHALAATAGRDALDAQLEAGQSAKGLRRQVEQIVALTETLEALPRAEAMTRWYLDLATGDDRAAVLERLIRAFPDAPETLAVCRMERDHPHDPAAAALATRHLARGLDGPDATT